MQLELVCSSHELPLPLSLEEMEGLRLLQLWFLHLGIDELTSQAARWLDLLVPPLGLINQWLIEFATCLLSPSGRLKLKEHK